MPRCFIVILVRGSKFSNNQIITIGCKQHVVGAGCGTVLGDDYCRPNLIKVDIKLRQEKISVTNCGVCYVVRILEKEMFMVSDISTICNLSGFTQRTKVIPISPKKQVTALCETDNQLCSIINNTRKDRIGLEQQGRSFGDRQTYLTNINCRLESVISPRIV